MYLANIFVKLSLYLKKGSFRQKNLLFSYKIFGKGKLAPALLHYYSDVYPGDAQIKTRMYPVIFCQRSFLCFSFLQVKSLEVLK